MAAMFVDVSIFQGVREFDTPRGMMRAVWKTKSVYIKDANSNGFIHLGILPKMGLMSTQQIYENAASWLEDEEADGDEE